MISFDQNGIRFKYRVAGLAVHDGYVLLTKTDQDRYWILPGGRVEINEDTRAALGRELLEETCQQAHIGNLLWIVEDFFYLDGTGYHELAFVYAISPINTAILDNAWTYRTTDGDTEIELRWFNLDRLEGVDFRPAFLKAELQRPPETTQHLIVREPPRSEPDCDRLTS
ncbi:MAG TPA: NUDIX domain-containing protein [Rubrobacter sp.]|nr:NUDIX domain-containing protein [Rubrobacter sp.]